MKVIKLGNNIELNKHKCNKCNSLLSYTKYDIQTAYGSYFRTGTESSSRFESKYIICPVCSNEITLKSWIEEY